METPPSSSIPPQRFRLLRRLLPLAVLLFLATWFLQKAPEPVEVTYVLGARAAGLERLEVTVRLLPDQALVRRAEFFFSRGAPTEVSQRLKLQDERRYQFELALVYPDRREALTREIPYDGAASLQLTW